MIAAIAAGPARPVFAGESLITGFIMGMEQKADLQKALAAGKTGQISFFDTGSIKNFYGQRDGKPFWTGDAIGIRRAEAVWAYLERAWTQGLNPAQYNVTEIGRLLKSSDPNQAVHLELLLTDAVMRYGHDISGMRLRPAAIGQDPKYWRRPLKGLAVMDGVAASDDPARHLASMAPQDATYRKLQAELTRLAVNAWRHNDFTPLDFGRGAARPGHAYKDMDRLRERLGVAYAGLEPERNIYDTRTADAVKNFQEQRGINPDGIIGPKTLALLNQPPRARMEQIVANMERMRWMDQQRPDRYVLVNIPQQMLWAVDKGHVAVQMAVVVGQVSRPTKAFKTQITGIRFNPHWTVPLSIKMKDFLPSLQEDPTVLARKGIDLYRIEDGQRVYIDPASVDWTEMSAADMSKFHMVQGSGDDNALGLIRVLMPNDYDIYLHDTNHRDLFAKNERFFSSGCIRLSDPVSMARFVLADRKVWSDDDMQQMIAKGAQKDIMIDHPLQIYITYLTIWPGPGGHLKFGNDIYGQDRQLIGAMDAAHAYWLPVPKLRKTASIKGSGNARFAAVSEGEDPSVR
jgi:murein L,D-transpeptidase YcbB/YkuD